MTEEKKDTDPFDDLIEAGAEAMMAALRGDNDGWVDNVKKGRKAYVDIQRRNLDRAMAEVEEKQRRMAMQSKEKRRREAKRNKVTTNLGDLLKEAGFNGGGKK